MITTTDDARALLLAAGVPEEEINAETIQIARVYNEIVTQSFTKLLAEQIAARFFNDEGGVFGAVKGKLELPKGGAR